MSEIRYHVGQEVLLGAEATATWVLAGAPRRGVVVGRQLDLKEARYAVGFPGEPGPRQIPAGALLPAPPFRQIRLGDRRLIRSLGAAKVALVQTAARIRVREAQGQRPEHLDVLDCNTLAAALDQRCHVPGGRTLAQLEPEIAAMALAFLRNDAIRAAALTDDRHPVRLARRDAATAPSQHPLPIVKGQHRAQPSRLNRRQWQGGR
jgi:hypothetical protein